MSRRRRPRRPRPAPQAIDTHSRTAALRSVAVFEAFKGTLVLLLELGVLAMVHKDFGELGEHLVRMLHINPDRPLSHAIVHAVERVHDTRLWAIVAAGVAYATVRYVEAYGLWNRRVWAEWFALLSGAMYLPWEIFELGQRATPIRAVVLLTNLIIVIYMLVIRMSALRSPVGEGVKGGAA